MCLPVTEPDAHHLLLHAERAAQHGDLLRRWLGVVQEGALESHAHARLDRGALLPAAAHRVGRTVRRSHVRRAAEHRSGHVTEQRVKERL